MKSAPKKKKKSSPLIAAAATIVIGLSVYMALVESRLFSVTYHYDSAASVATSSVPMRPTLDILGYNERLIRLAGYGTTTAETGIIATSSAWLATSSSISSPLHRWPVPTVYPLGGAVLPFSRIVAYYGNFYSAQMGILGQYPLDEVANKLTHVVNEWQAADPNTPVIPGIDYIAVVAQGSPGADGKYILRMPDSEIEKAIAMAHSMAGLVFLDIQPGLSNLETEVPLLDKYLQMPEVELAIDPEFSMKNGVRPGRQIGTMDARDVNYAAEHLAKLVQAYNLPPKILLVHRFTEEMITNYEYIKPLPEVQIVMNMDGWSSPLKKIKTYNTVITPEPVQFAGIKLFYKNDALPPSPGLLTPKQVLSLHPAPIFIEYQ